MPKTKVDPSLFTATQWDTAEDKADFVNHFILFVRSDFSEAYFTKKFYTRLSMTFGHIAHYNQAGFYGTFFDSTEGKLAFLKRTATYHCCGDRKFTYSDVEKYLRKWVVEQGLVRKYETRLAKETEADERALLAKLKAKYEEVP